MTHSPLPSHDGVAPWWSTLPPDVALATRDLGKCYRIYNRPEDRLKQAIFRRRRYFREFWAVKGASLEIRRGETVGIMGRNGCGKSTLLQMGCGVLRPTTGAVHVNGRIAALLELGAGFNPEFSGHDNVYTSAAILGLSPGEIRARYDEIVSFSELGDFIHQPVKTYSSGMYVRLAFAVAISVEPDILVVDEALAVGDEAFQRKCYARIQAIQKRGGTILFVTHSAGTIVDLCQRAVLLEQGEVLLSGAPKTVVSRYHKLIYAPPQRAAEIVAEIRREAAQGPEAEKMPPAATPAVVPETSSAQFDPHMKSKSAVVYPSHGATILDPQITTPGGRPANLLVPHEEYVIRYRVRFDQPAYHVRWGSMIRNVLGTEISGMATPHPRGPATDCVAAGTEVELAFRFRCELMAGAYFANVGLMGVVDGQMSYLHRIVDALMFRVLGGYNRAHTGLSDLFLEAQTHCAPQELPHAA